MGGLSKCAPCKGGAQGCTPKPKPKSALPAKLSKGEREQLSVLTRLSEREVQSLYERFRAVSMPNMHMSVEQFRGTLGILGVSQNNFLSDALFRVFTGGDDKLTYTEFIQHLAIMLRGSEDEKLALSFSLSLTTPGINEDGTTAALPDLPESLKKQIQSGDHEEGERRESENQSMPVKLLSKLRLRNIVGTQAVNAFCFTSAAQSKESKLSIPGDGTSGKTKRETQNAMESLKARIELAEVSGIRLEQFRELIRAIDTTTNSLLPASYQKEISDEMIEAIFYHIAANEFFYEPRRTMGTVAINIPGAKRPSDQEDDDGEDEDSDGGEDDDDGRRGDRDRDDKRPSILSPLSPFGKSKSRSGTGLNNNGGKKRDKSGDRTEGAVSSSENEMAETNGSPFGSPNIGEEGRAAPRSWAGDRNNVVPSPGNEGNNNAQTSSPASGGNNSGDGLLNNNTGSSNSKPPIKEELRRSRSSFAVLWKSSSGSNAKDDQSHSGHSHRHDSRASSHDRAGNRGGPGGNKGNFTKSRSEADKTGVDDNSHAAPVSTPASRGRRGTQYAATLHGQRNKGMGSPAHRMRHRSMTVGAQPNAGDDASVPLEGQSVGSQSLAQKLYRHIVPGKDDRGSARPAGDEGGNIPTGVSEMSPMKPMRIKSKDSAEGFDSGAKKKIEDKKPKVITLDAYKNAVRNSPEFLELIGLLPPTKTLTPPPKLFQHNDRIFSITKPYEFWSTLVELRDEMRRRANTKPEPKPPASDAGRSNKDKHSEESNSCIHPPVDIDLVASRSEIGGASSRGLPDPPKIFELEDRRGTDPERRTTVGEHEAPELDADADADQLLEEFTLSQAMQRSKASKASSSSRVPKETTLRLSQLDGDADKMLGRSMSGANGNANGNGNKQADPGVDQATNKPVTKEDTMQRAVRDALTDRERVKTSSTDIDELMGPSSGSQKDVQQGLADLDAIELEFGGNIAQTGGPIPANEKEPPGVSFREVLESTKMVDRSDEAWWTPIPGPSSGPGRIGPSTLPKSVTSSSTGGLSKRENMGGAPAARDSHLEKQLQKLFSMLSTVTIEGQEENGLAGPEAALPPGGGRQPSPTVVVAAGRTTGPNNMGHSSPQTVLPNAPSGIRGGASNREISGASPNPGDNQQALLPCPLTITISGVAPSGVGANLTPNQSPTTNQLLINNLALSGGPYAAPTDPNVLRMRQRNTAINIGRESRYDSHEDMTSLDTKSRPGRDNNNNANNNKGLLLAANGQNNSDFPTAKDMGMEMSPTEHFTKSYTSFHKESAKKKKNERKKEKGANLKSAKKGLAVHFGHENWNMVVNMMIGIRMAVGRVSNEMDRNVQALDFKMRDKFVILPNIANIVSAISGTTTNYTIFVDYAPFVFRKIRDLRNIDTEQYLRSVGPEQLLGNMILGNLSSLSELSSEGKSGAFFYYTADGSYMIKTVTEGEKNLLYNILPQYWQHIQKYPNNLIIKFFGLHGLRIKKEDSAERKIYFVVMGNMFNTPFEIHRRYDLKGSTVKRISSERQKRDRTRAMKDLDFLVDGQAVPIGKEGYEILCQQLEKDAFFLAKCNIIDYSVLLGIHEVADDDVPDFQTALDEINDQLKAEKTFEMNPVQRRITTALGVPPGRAQRTVVGASNKQAPNALVQQVAYHEQHFGGLASTDPTKPCLFFIGVIDILTNYGWRKVVEHNGKSCLYANTWRGVSCCPPNLYAKRFVDFMRKKVFYIEPQTQEETENTMATATSYTVPKLK